MRPDRGSASIWVLSCAALVLVVASVVTVRTAAVVARHRAESAADLAALAGALQIGVGQDVCGAAARIAARNGARLASCHPSLAEDGRSGTVVIAVIEAVHLPIVGAQRVHATARAGRLAVP